jgi:uncharacterized protein YqgV (UPF0045/DUF77 family)
MEISAQVSLYPLRQEKLGPAIETFVQALAQRGIEAQVGPMSTLVSGGAGPVFTALKEAFEQVAAQGPVAMVITVSNACPVPGR